ncbi:class I adenylate-forming enzyme family protein [Caenimonas soli]|uniref:class I adenylate-forming enzyme family protein n=1 Tax=Caenimonas soli TaxID=2735555 RepID=UPI001554C4BE|nr:AMP-binding protein [Caenimonas soli]NPC55268.1 AMP-binding protein [Caenimonas soli]
MRPIDFLLRSAQDDPGRVAITGPGVSLTYGQLVAQSSALAAALQAFAPDPRARICVCGGNDASHIVALMATLMAGRIWVPLNPRAGRAEIQRIVEFTEPAVIVVAAGLAAKLPDSGARTIRWSDEGSTGPCELTEVIRRHPGAAPRELFHPAEETQAIKFTGGTTGTPKGVMQSLRSWNACIVSLMHALRLTRDDRYLAVAPITHGTSTFLLPMFGCGGTVVLPGASRPRDILDTLERERVTAVFMPPTLIYSLLDDESVGRRDWTALRHLVYSAAPMRPEKVAQAQRVFGHIETAYGQTEAPAIISFLRADEAADPARINSVGRAGLLTRIAILNPSGELLAPGEVGEIAVRGDLVMSGYWRQPEKTSETMADGWLRTGDSGYLDEQGYLFLKDRVRDVIITGGFNVYPADVENVLGQHPAVYDCLVVGVDDAHWGEAVHAAVQLREGATVPQGELVAWVKAKLDSVKAPKAVHLFDELPRTANGKLSRRDARQQIASRLQPQGTP